MTYRECPYYDGGYCSLEKNYDGINESCCERNDCPDIPREKINREQLKKKSNVKPTDRGVNFLEKMRKCSICFCQTTEEQTSSSPIPHWT